MSEMDIILNGERRRVPGPSSLADLLQHLELDPRTVVVELNRSIVRRANLSTTLISPGDSVELVHFVGGG
jgi:thiamine biosynthesis protein ThiS